MTLFVRQSADLAKLNAGWFETTHQFADSTGINLAQQGFGALKLWGTDVIQPGTGFDSHPHSDLEIVTIVLEGELTHSDSLGNIAVLRAGDVSVMSAGRGITHSERNEGATPLRLHQIWMRPAIRGQAPCWSSVSESAALPTSHWLIRVSDRPAAPARLNLPATVATCQAKPDQPLRWDLGRDRAAYLVLSSGGVRTSDGQSVAPGDGLVALDTTAVDLRAVAPSHIVLIDLPRPAADYIHIPMPEVR